jgi:hypothetical protein
MSFFIRVWKQGSEVPFINSRDDEITWDMVDIKPSIVIDAEVVGNFMDAGQVRSILSLTNDNFLLLSGRELLWQKISTR